MRIIRIAFLGLLGTILSLPVFGAELDRGIAAYQSKRYSEALQVLLPLANGGNDEAQRIVGEMCFNGQGMKRNLAAAFKWNELAAESGNKVAQFNLGYLYEKGEGVNASRNQAMDWYAKAARQGHPAAQRKLGDLYADLDRNQSIYWYDQARQSGDEQALAKYSDLSVAREKQRDAQKEEARRAAEIEERRLAEEERARERERQAERARQQREDEENSKAIQAQMWASTQANIANGMGRIAEMDRGINAAVAESRRVQAEQAAQRERAREEREEQAARQRREAERERAAGQRVAEAPRQEEANARERQAAEQARQAREMQVASADSSSKSDASRYISGASNSAQSDSRQGGGEHSTNQTRRKKYVQNGFNDNGARAAKPERAIEQDINQLKRKAEEWVAERRHNGSVPVHGVITDMRVREGCTAYKQLDDAGGYWARCILDITYEADDL